MMFEITATRLPRLRQALDGVRHVTILPHVDPDPDAIASAAGLQRLLQVWGITADIAFEGRIGRAENKSLVAYLDYPLAPLLRRPRTPILIVDTQPGVGNSPVAADVPVLAAIDHHPHRAASDALPYSDVRPGYGATATIVTEYLRQAGIEPDEQLATALLYGIKTDTLDLERKTTAADVEAYEYLRPRIDRSALQQIEVAQVSADYFRLVHATLEAALVYDRLLFAWIGEMPYPDLAAEMADWLMRYDGASHIACAGVYRDRVHLSARTHPPVAGADEMMLAMVDGLGSGGGHSAMAGGQIPLGEMNPTRLARLVRRRALRHLELPPDTSPQRLLSS